MLSQLDGKKGEPISPGIAFIPRNGNLPQLPFWEFDTRPKQRTIKRGWQKGRVEVTFPNDTRIIVSKDYLKTCVAIRYRREWYLIPRESVRRWPK